MISSRNTFFSQVETITILHSIARTKAMYLQWWDVRYLQINTEHHLCLGNPTHTHSLTQAELLHRFRIQKESQIWCKAAWNIREVPTVQAEVKTWSPRTANGYRGQEWDTGTKTMRYILTVCPQSEVGFVVPVPWAASLAWRCLKNPTGSWRRVSPKANHKCQPHISSHTWLDVHSHQE